MQALASYESNLRLLPSGRIFYNAQSAQQRINVANQLNFWRSLGNTTFQERVEGTAPNYSDKLYELGELASRSYFIRSYFPKQTAIDLRQCIASWTSKLRDVSSIRAAVRHSTVKGVEQLEVAALINFAHICSPYHVLFKLKDSTRTFIKLTCSIDAAADCLAQYAIDQVPTFVDHGDLSKQYPLLLPLGTANTLFAFQESENKPLKRSAVSSGYSLEMEVKQDTELTKILESFRVDRFDTFASKMRQLAKKKGIELQTDALTEIEAIMKIKK